MKKIALTGNMGTGKSYVASCLRQLHIAVLDMDVCAKEVREQQQEHIYKMFNVTCASSLANMIFHDDRKREALETFLYPLMIEKMYAFFEHHHQDEIVVVEVPLLFEKQWEHYFDEVWCVVCSEQIALQRLIKERHMKQEDIIARWQKQWPLAVKIQRSDVLIHNDEQDDVLAQLHSIIRG